MKKDTNIKGELTSLSPLLAKMQGKSEKAAVPKDYFDTLDKSIFEKIEAERTVNKTKKSSIFLLFRPWMSMAASVLLVLGGALWAWQHSHPTTPVENPDAVAIVTSQEALEYVDNNIDDFEIIAFYTEEQNATDDDLFSDYPDDLLDGISDQELSDFLN